MRTKNQNHQKIITGALPIAVVLFAWGCNSGGKPADTPKDTVIVQVPKTDTVAPDPSAPFYGTWEREENGVYSTETFSKTTKDGEKYKGTISEQNLVIADYTIHGNSIEIAYNNSAKHGAHTLKYDFSINDGGNTINLQSTPPIVYHKGSHNTSLQDEAYMFVTSGGAGTWANTDNPKLGLDFADVTKSDQGWSGTYKKWDNGTVAESGEFSIPRQGSITMKPVGVAAKTYVYKFKNNNAILELTRDNISELYRR